MNYISTPETAAQRAGVSEPYKPAFPDLNPNGPQVNAKDHEVAGTALHSILAWTVWGICVLVLLLTTWGVGALAFLVAWMLDFIVRRRVMASLRASCLELGPQQLPEVYACAQVYAQRLGLKETPRIFIAEGSAMNAASLRVGARKVVLLVDDVVWGALKAGDPRALSFVLAHELAHHALGHTGGVRRYLSQVYRKLSRLDEFSCDAVAFQLVGEREAAYNGLIMLMVGPQLLPFVNRDQLFKQAQEADADKHTLRAERVHTHPFLARRIHALRNVALARGTHG
jgi:Zn-dependent protease with chaperone function